jgi:peptide/nickel transport system substrate-binding protein
VFQNAFTRRNLLGLALMSTGAVATACSGSAGERPPSGPGGQSRRMPGGFRESPLLAQQVKSGDLPPLKERLPKKPYVVSPGILVDDEFTHMKPGKFGGTFQLAQESPAGDPIIFIGVNEPLIWAPNGLDFSEKPGIHGNVVDDWEVNSDDSVYTFHMRQGLRWSDGEPVTMDDVTFAFEDVLNNKEITPIFPDYLQAGKRADAAPAKLDVIDDWTFSLTFDESYGTFPMQLAIFGWRGYGDIIKPRHYLEQFHQKYASKAKLAQLVKDESLPEGEWFNLFNAKQLTSWLWNATTEQGLGHPTLLPWVLTKVDGGTFTYDRNPYYFKVDSEGNQLPYMDGIRSQVVQNKETLTSRALFGEFDYLGERATFRKLELFAEKADSGDINILIPNQHVIPTTIFLNLTHPDKVWRQVTGDLRFRQALSLAMNREELIENFYLGEFAKLPTETNSGEFSPEKARQLLDEMGLDKTDSEGWRLGPDGKRFRIPFEVADLSENHIPLAELVAEYWKEVGVYTTLRKIDSTVLGERQELNELKATVIWVHHPIWRSAGMDDYLPFNNWGPQWQLWHATKGEEGEEPPPKVRELFDMHTEFTSARLGSPESDAAIEGIIKSIKDNVWMLNPFENADWPTFFTKRVKNVATGVKRDVYGIIVTYSMEQWYLEDE